MVTTVQRNDPSIVHHLVEDDDVVGRLEDLEVLVVAGGNNRRARVEAHQTPLGKPPVLVAVGPDPSGPDPNRTGAGYVFSQRESDHFNPWLQRWNTAVDRLDDEGRAGIIDHACTAIEPEVVIATYRGTSRERLGSDLTRSICLHGRLG